MLIRSQSKEDLINFSNVKTLEVVKGYNSPVDTTQVYVIKCMFSKSDFFDIALYSSREKAVKVLDMIQKAYYNHEQALFKGCENASYSSCIFEMPEDSEVKL